MKLSDEQYDFLRKLDYLSKDEIRDLIEGWTDLEVLLDPVDLENFLKIK